ncbi:hypothetical protein [Nitrosomonas ureae]|uniref:Uncharacterized protein n=1 Tax=Nitrosomonas ureae TaxID=44577 RepID=A0A1H2ENU7_9PROT|nr:hypothetical protein [Nitrosomonas ureae]ALQ51909.1 hypothetical protein ATY38_12175 [Nitrosomonas ureae]SDT96714.1 hypothetical protein SAMN05216406_11433 [Nitrosomonas ureae]
MKIKFLADPGHGWAKVKRSLLIELGIEKEISAFSYQLGEWVYLEEDCDLSLFLKTINEKGVKVEFSDHFAKTQSKVRSYQSFRSNTAQQVKP